jgi:hypothetical protein
MNQITAVTDTRANLELARAFADAKLVPDHFKKSVGDCYIAVNLANRYGMDPWTLMQELYIVNGRPMMSGKLAIAILNHSLAEPLRPEYSGAGDEREITLTGRSEGDEKRREVKLKVRDAKTNNEQWKKQPDQMLMYSGARTWGRRFAPDILLGIVFDDEEIPGVTAPASPPAALAAAPGLKPQAPPLHDPETGEIKPPHEIEVQNDPNGEPETFVVWGKRFLDHVKTSGTTAEIAAWNQFNADKLVEIKEAAPKVYDRLEAAINAHRIRLDATDYSEAP